MQHYTPAAPAVRKTLERLLASETFSRSERARDLIQYLVEREQAGEAAKLKGFSIAMDVFGKDAGFDPSTDAVVRVQAGRLRELLQQYFTTEGAGEPLRIIIPRGTYVPAYEFDTVCPTLAPDLPASPHQEQLSSQEETKLHANSGTSAVTSINRHLLCLWLAIAIVVAALAFLILRQSNILSTVGANLDTVTANTSLTARNASIQGQKSLPTVYLSVIDDKEEGSRVATAMRTGLSGFDTINFIGRKFIGDPDPKRDATKFIFKVLPGQATGNVTVELQNIGTGRVLLSRVLEATEIEAANVDDKIAGLLSATVPASGSIYSYIDISGLQSGLTRCLLLNDDFYQAQDARKLETTYRCFEKLIAEDGKSPLIYSELSALHLEAVVNHYAYPPSATIEGATELAHRAMQISATSPYVYRAFGYLNTRLGNSEDATRWLRRAYELNTYDLTMAAAYGYGLVFAGDYVQGTKIMERAVEASTAHPPWWDFGLFLGDFMLGNMDGAREAAISLTSANSKSQYLAARLIVADAAGDEHTKAELLREITSRFPNFATNLRQIFTGRKYPRDLTDRLVKALLAAGLGKAS